MKRLVYIVVMLMVFLSACEQQKEHTAPAILDRDSVPVMTTMGVNTLISDSGVMKYRIITEEWKINQNLHTPRWIFEKAIFLEQFDEKFKPQTYIQADTAYYYAEKRLWELRGRVHVKTSDGLVYDSEQLYWDERMKQLYSNTFSRLVTPERSLQGSYFWSNETMTKYYVSNSKGSFEKGIMDKDDDGGANAGSDTLKGIMRPQATPVRRSTSSNR